MMDKLVMDNRVNPSQPDGKDIQREGETENEGGMEMKGDER